MAKKYHSSMGKRVKALEKHEEYSHGESMKEIGREQSLRGNANRNNESFSDEVFPERGGYPLPDNVIMKEYPRNPTASFPELDDTIRGIDKQNSEDASKVKHGKFPYKA